MLELDDLPGRSPIVRICRFGTCHLKKVGRTAKSAFCDQKLGVLTVWCGDVFFVSGGPLRKNSPIIKPLFKGFLYIVDLMTALDTVRGIF